jgi:hypothetical protein
MNTRPSPIRASTEPNDNPEQYCREFRAIPAPEDTETAEIPCMGIVTELELVALRVVDAAERIEEPINKWDVVRATVRLVAWLAR